MDLSTLTLRELLTLARDRLGTRATGLKTRSEVLAALAEPPQDPSVAPIAGVEAQAGLVRSDFFRRKHG